uniref:Uncharacterized protein n=1 Tax=Tanacetum cinerariifolium TaxID=118510 RepID=A0A6L2L1S8_TANCI|nr:hypothetical protein [Tanacetum cinerariifolium]
MDQRAANIPYLLAQYFFRLVEGRKNSAKLSGGHFVGRLAHHFGLVSDDGLRGLSVVTHEISLIDMGELVKLNICREIRDDWAWVARDQRGSRLLRLVPLRRLRMLLQSIRVLRLIHHPYRHLSRHHHLYLDASGQTNQAFDDTFRGSSPTVFERRTRQRTKDASTSITR